MRIPFFDRMSEARSIVMAGVGGGFDVLSFGLLTALQERQMTGRHRPAQLFRFDQKRYIAAPQEGVQF